MNYGIEVHGRYEEEVDAEFPRGRTVCIVRETGKPRRDMSGCRTSLTDHRRVNAMAESFFASLDTELLDRQPWRTRDDLADATVE